VKLLEHERVDATAMKRLYDERFSDFVAHREWLAALGLA
jgi:hypothetical protein